MIDHTSGITGNSFLSMPGAFAATVRTAEESSVSHDTVVIKNQISASDTLKQFSATVNEAATASDIGGVTSSSVAASVMPGPVGCVLGKEAAVMIEDLQKGLVFRNFRTMDGEFRRDDGLPPPSREGLDSLMASGSSEFTHNGLERIMKRVPGGKMVVFDLREESHGFINDRAVSWKGERNWANKGDTLAAVKSDEEKRLAGLNENNEAARSVCNEEAICRDLSARYERIPVTDHLRPEDRDVDNFIETSNSMPDNSWLHFHCKAGKGRTTTFLAMNDMIHNAKTVSIDDIVRRQYLLGGINLFDKKDKDVEWKKEAVKEREAFIREFYEYCRSNEDGFRESWSEWLRKTAQSTYQMGILNR
ncbi:MAG: phosphatase [Vulcanimicrobiota bacterium]